MSKASSRQLSGTSVREIDIIAPIAVEAGKQYYIGGGGQLASLDDFIPKVSQPLFSNSGMNAATARTVAEQASGSRAISQPLGLHRGLNPLIIPMSADRTMIIGAPSTAYTSPQNLVTVIRTSTGEVLATALLAMGTASDNYCSQVLASCWGGAGASNTVRVLSLWGNSSSQSALIISTITLSGSSLSIAHLTPVISYGGVTGSLSLRGMGSGSSEGIALITQGNTDYRVVNLLTNTISSITFANGSDSPSINIAIEGNFAVGFGAATITVLNLLTNAVTSVTPTGSGHAAGRQVLRLHPRVYLEVESGTGPRALLVANEAMTSFTATSIAHSFAYTPAASTRFTAIQSTEASNLFTVYRTLGNTNQVGTQAFTIEVTPAGALVGVPKVAPASPDFSLLLTSLHERRVDVGPLNLRLPLVINALAVQTIDGILVDRLSWTIVSYRPDMYLERYAPVLVGTAKTSAAAGSPCVMVTSPNVITVTAEGTPFTLHNRCVKLNDATGVYLFGKSKSGGQGFFLSTGGTSTTSNQQELLTTAGGFSSPILFGDSEPVRGTVTLQYPTNQSSGQNSGLGLQFISPYGVFYTGTSGQATITVGGFLLLGIRHANTNASITRYTLNYELEVEPYV